MEVDADAVGKSVLGVIWGGEGDPPDGGEIGGDQGDEGDEGDDEDADEGEEQADEGTIEWERGADFGYLPQESAPVGDESILHIATSGKKLEPENDDDYDIDWTLEPLRWTLPSRLPAAQRQHIEARLPAGRWVSVADALELGLPAPVRKLLSEPGKALGDS